jgi:hypothetical protein
MDDTTNIMTDTQPRNGDGQRVLASKDLLGRVLVACEYSGTVRDAFASRGWDAWSCDLLPSETPGNHHQCDVREVLAEKWDMMIAHPICTYMTNSGVCWLHKDAERWRKLFDAADFFCELLAAPIPHIALENPVMHKYAKRLVGVKQTQVVQPWMFGHMEGKATCLWLKNLPPLTATNNVKTEMMKLPINQRQRLHYLPPSETRWKERSRTFSGLAEAMANQWTLATRSNPILYRAFAPVIL